MSTTTTEAEWKRIASMVYRAYMRGRDLEEEGPDEAAEEDLQDR